MPAYQGPSYRRRALSIILVSALHAVLLFALLRFMVQPQTRPVLQAERLLEMILRPQAPATRPQAAQPQTSIAPRRERGRATVSPVPSFAPPAQAPDITALGRALTGCAPENLSGNSSSLSPQERAHCPGAFHKPDESVVAEPPSHVKDRARRAAEMAAKNRPGRIPCTYIGSTGAPGGGGAAPMVDPICAINGLINGFEPLNGLPK